MPDLTPDPADERVETIAMLLHVQRHPAGFGQACDRCRADALAELAATEGQR